MVKKFLRVVTVLLLTGLISADYCSFGDERAVSKADIVFLHHSTGANIWNGGVPEWFATNAPQYRITERSFPKSSPYGWKNYPYDYWNIWVRQAGSSPYKGEPTLEMLVGSYDMIIFKHCFPVSGIREDTGNPDVASEDKRVENYKLQYNALKDKMHQFPKTKFLVWTGAALVRNGTNEASARRTRAFFDWVRTDWDNKGDNIYLFDFYALETGGDLFMQDQYAASRNDSHPDKAFSQQVAPLFCRRIVNILGGRGDSTSLTGE